MVRAPLHFLYLVGLEHTGHHFWQHGAGVYNWMAREGYATGVSWTLGLALTGPDFERDATVALKNPAEGRRLDDAIAEKYRPGLIQRWKKELEMFNGTNRTIVPVNACSYGCGKSCARLTIHSQPQQGTCGYPDARVLMQSAEAAGADLRMLYLTRPAVEVMRDDFARNNGYTEPRTEYLLSQCRVMSEQLSQVS